MKKLVSLFLSLVLVVTAVSLSFTAFAQDDSLSVAVGSDLHFNLPREELEYTIDDEMFFYANRRSAMEDESGFIIDEFLRQCAEDETVEYVLICGDLADNGRTIIEEHETVAAKLKAFEEKTGKQVFVTNGNHDTGVAETDTKNEDFKRIYNDFGYGDALVMDDDTLSYTADMGEKYRLIVADSCDPTVSTEDGLTAKRVDWIVEQAKAAYADGRYPVLMMHHNLLSHMPVQRILSHDFIVRNHSLSAEKIANAGIKTVFTGHEHGSDVMTYTSASGNTVTDFSTTSLTMYPLEYRYVTFTDDEISYEARSIDKIDTDALTSVVNGYTQEHIDFMNSDLREYSKQFFKVSIQYRLALGMSREKLGIDEDAFYAGLVFDAVDGLTSLLEMPLYGEGSVSELAKEYNIDLPESNYKNGWDVATEVVSYHYAGNEPFAIDSPEVTLVLKVAGLILYDDLSNINDKYFLGAANYLLSLIGTDSICKELTKLGTKVFGPFTAGEYFIVAIASPLLYGLAYDRDGVDDNNGSIEGYAVNNNSQNIRSNVTGFFEKLALYISLFFRYFIKIFRIF